MSATCVIDKIHVVTCVLKDSESDRARERQTDGQRERKRGGERGREKERETERERMKAALLEGERERECGHA